MCWKFLFPSFPSPFGTVVLGLGLLIKEWGWGGGSSQRVRDSNFKMSIRVDVEKENWLKIRKFIKDWQSISTYLVGGLMMVHQSRRE